jgi:hypothetical protein
MTYGDLDRVSGLGWECSTCGHEEVTRKGRAPTGCPRCGGEMALAGYVPGERWFYIPEHRWLVIPALVGQVIVALMLALIALGLVVAAVMVAIAIGWWTLLILIIPVWMFGWGFLLGEHWWRQS